MKAAALGEHRHAVERAGDQLALVANHAGLRKPGDVGVLDLHRIPQLVAEESEAGSEDDRGARLARLDGVADGRRGGLHVGCGAHVMLASSFWMEAQRASRSR